MPRRLVRSTSFQQGWPWRPSRLLGLQILPPFLGFRIFLSCRRVSQTRVVSLPLHLVASPSKERIDGLWGSSLHVVNTLLSLSRQNTFFSYRRNLRSQSEAAKVIVLTTSISFQFLHCVPCAAKYRLLALIGLFKALRVLFYFSSPLSLKTRQVSALKRARTHSIF